MKKFWITAAIVAVVVLAGLAVWLFVGLQQQKQVVEEMQELAELDKQEMENEYEHFTLQYSEMMTQINNDSIVAQLTQEQLRTQQLLEELKQTKANDAREIARLKKELATVREVLRSFIRQVDSLNQVNDALRSENSQIRSELAQTNREMVGLQNEKVTLSEKVAIAAQLDATAIRMTLLNKRNKQAKKMKDCKQIQVDFTIAKNVTASNGQKTLYVRIQTPTGETLNGGGSFAYEDRQLVYSMKKVVEYTGEETAVTTYWTVSEFLSAGDYRVSIFADGNMIGTKTFGFK
jgi:chromosome segregation ATPase